MPNVMGNQAEVGYFHMHKNGVDTVFIDHQCHSVADNIYAATGTPLTSATPCSARRPSRLSGTCRAAKTAPRTVTATSCTWPTTGTRRCSRCTSRADHQDHGSCRPGRCLSSTTWRSRAAVPDEFYFLQLPDHYKEHRLDDPFGGECMNQMQAGLKPIPKIIAASAGHAAGDHHRHGRLGPRALTPRAV